MKPETMKRPRRNRLDRIYDQWLDERGDKHPHWQERLGGMCMLLWLQERGLLEKKGGKA